MTSHKTGTPADWIAARMELLEALTSDRGRLESVVSRAELGASLSMGYLERKLGG
jgi:hypothetical protein